MDKLSAKLTAEQCEWELTLTRQRIFQILPILPYKTGRSWVTLDAESFNAVFEFIMRQASTPRFEHTLLTMAELIEQIVEDTGWTVSVRPGTSDLAEVVALPTAGDVSFDRVNESFTWVIIILVCGLSQYLLSQAGLKPEGSWEKDGTDFMAKNPLYQVTLRLIHSRGKSLPKFPSGPAKRLLHTLMRVAPPNLEKATARRATAPLCHMHTLSAMVWLGCMRMFETIALLNPEVFEDMPARAFRATFGDPAKISFDPQNRPIYMGALMAGTGSDCNLKQPVDALCTLTSPQHIEAMAYIVVRSITKAFCYGVRTGVGMFERAEPKVRRTTAQLIAFYNSRSAAAGAPGRSSPPLPPGIDYKDLNMHTLITRLALLCNYDVQWWKRKSKQLVGWRRFAEYYRQLLKSTKHAENCAAVTYFGLVSEHLQFEVSLQTANPQVTPLVDMYTEMYEDAKACIKRIIVDSQTPVAALNATIQIHVTYSMVLPQQWFQDHFGHARQNTPPMLNLAALCFGTRLQAHDPTIDALYLENSDLVVDHVCYALEHAHTAEAKSEAQALWHETSFLGVVHLRHAVSTTRHMSVASQLKLSKCIINTASTMTPKIRDYSVWIFIVVVTLFDNQSLDALIEIHYLLCTMLRDAQDSLLVPVAEGADSLGCDAQYIHDLLKARLHTTRKILKLDPEKLYIDAELEYKCRASINVLLCSADRALTLKSVACMRLISEEISEWVHAKIHVDGFMRESLFDQSIFQWIYKMGQSHTLNGLMMHTLVQKLSQVFPNPDVTGTFREFSHAVRRLWLAFVRQANPVKSPLYRKTMVNLMVFSSWWSAGLYRSNHPNAIEDCTGVVHEILVGVLSPDPYIRDASITASRSYLIPSPDFAFLCVMAGLNYSLSIASTATNQATGEIDDIKVARQLSLINCCLIRSMTEAAKLTKTPGFDVPLYHKLMFMGCRKYIFSATDPFPEGDTFFKSLMLISEAKTLLICSKFDSFEDLVNLFLDELRKNPDVACAKPMCLALTAVLEDYTFYSTPSGSFSVFDTRYAAFKDAMQVLLAVIKHYNGKNKVIVDSLHQAIVNLGVANQEMAVVFFEEATTLENSVARAALYKSFEISFSENITDADPRRQEEIINVLLQDDTICQAICDVCPFEESAKVVSHLTTVFCEYNRGFELAKWAFLKDLESAKSASELFRKNTLYVQLLLGVLNLHLKRGFYKIIQDAVSYVYMNPFLFARADEDPEHEESQMGEKTVVALTDSCLVNIEATFSVTVIKTVQFIREKVEEKFPGYFNTAFRNLLFLRIICPILVLPHNFGLVTHVPEGPIRDGLLCFAKYLQKLNVGGDPTAMTPGARRIREMFDAICAFPCEKHQLEPSLADAQLLSTSAVQRSFYSLHQFFYRHSKELLIYLQMHTHTPHPNSVDFLGVKLFKASFVQQQQKLQNPSAQENRRNSSSAFTRLLAKLGHPSLAFYTDRERSSSKRSSGRKSIVPWSGNEEGCPITLKFLNGQPHLILSTSASNPTTPTGLQTFLADLRRKIETIQQSGTLPIAIFDCTWQKTDDEMSEMYVREIRGVAEDTGLQCSDVINLNISFLHFESMPTTNSKERQMFKSKMYTYLTTADVDTEWSRQIELSSETRSLIKDIEAAQKFDNVVLTVAGTQATFTVYVGKQYIHIISPLGCCDTFAFESVRLVNGSIILQKQRGSFKVEFMLHVGTSSDLHLTLWEQLNASRARTQGGSTKPLLELNVNRFSSYLLCQCMLDLASANEMIRQRSLALLPWVTRKFNLSSAHLDLSVLISSLQISRVVAVSKAIAVSHPEIVFDLLRSFIDIASKGPQFLTHASVDIMTPWFDQMFATTPCSETKKSHTIDVIVRSMLSLKTTFDTTMGPAKAKAMLEPLWPLIVQNTEGSEYVLDVYFGCTLFRMAALDESVESLVISLPLPTPTIHYLVEHYLLRDEKMEKMNSSLFRWSDYPSWPRLVLAVSIFNQIIWESSEQVISLLPHISMNIFLFSAVGPRHMRQSFHHLVNMVINQLVCSKRVDAEGIEHLRHILVELNSDRGLLLFGVQDGLNDDDYDMADFTTVESCQRIYELIMEVWSSVYTPNQVQEYRSQLCARLHTLTPSQYVALRRRAFVMKVLMIDDRKHQIFLQEDFTQGRSAIANSTHVRHLYTIIENFDLYVHKFLGWLDDEQMGRYTCWSISLLAMGLTALQPLCIRLQKWGLQHFIVRRANDPSLKLVDYLSDLGMPGYQQFWRENAHNLTSLPELDEFFAAKISEQLFTLLLNDNTKREALTVCECWLKIGQCSPELGSFIEISLLLYVFDPTSGSFETLGGFGTLVDFDDKLSVERIEQRLSDDISNHPEAGICAVVNVCTLLLRNLAVPTSARLLNVICRLTDLQLLQDLQPLIWPLWSKIISLIDLDSSTDTTEWYERFLYAMETRTDSFDASLNRVQAAMAKCGRPYAIDDEYHLREPRMVHEFTDDTIPLILKMMDYGERI